jgi:hypothetical protein
MLRRRLRLRAGDRGLELRELGLDVDALLLEARTRLRLGLPCCLFG